MHQCPVCPKSFPSPYKLQRHYVIHTGQKPFICKICGKAYTQSEHLKTHLQNVHHSRLPPDRLPDDISTHNRQPSCDNPAAEINTCNYTSERKWEVVTHKNILPSTEIENPPKNVPNHGSVTRNSNSDVMDPLPQEQVDSANVDTSVRNVHSGYTCKVCLKSFTSSLQLWIHSSTHNKPKQFERSRESGQTSSKKAHSKVHLQSEELNSSTSKMTLQHKCPKCLKTFCSPSKLQRHFLIHTGQKPYSCVTCWKTFRQKVHLKSHLSTANKCSLERKRQRFCDGRQTLGVQPQSSLRQRAIKHCTPVNSSVELELQCKISVNTTQDLNETELESDAVVNPEQPLNIRSQCPSITLKSDEQEQQYLTHKDLKPFQCTICNRSFRLEVNLIRHHKIHRNKNELGSPTTVQISNNVKISDSQAMKHLPEPSHGDPIDVNIASKPGLSVNCSDHSDCLPRDSEFITSAEQRRKTYHTTSKQQRINTLRQCHTCFKCFPSLSKLQRHMMTHTGQRPFGCETCGKRFRQKTHLKVHFRTHSWSRYHKQRSLYINRPPSCIGGFNARTAADVPIQEMLIHKRDFETRSGSGVSVKHFDQAPSRELDKTLLPLISRKSEVMHLRKVSKVTVKRTQLAKSKQNPGNVPHKCFQCLKCFPSASKLQRHEMVHTGLKPFRCLMCGKAFRQAPHLKTHERSHCENIRKLNANSQQQLSPRISVCVLPQKTSANTDATLSHSDGADCNGVSELLCLSHEISTTKVNSLSKTNSKSKVTCKKRTLHTCRICFKNFLFPYKLSRHLLTHSGIRPYKCTLCCKTFTQRGHLKIHEHRCRQNNGISHYNHGETINTNHLQDKYTENLFHCADFNVEATREQPESHYTSDGQYSFTDGDLSYCSEAIDTEWLAVPEVGLQEENNESVQRENCNQATDHYSSSFPSELAFEINKLVQNQNMAAPPLSHQFEGKTHNVEAPCQPEGVISHSNKLLSDERVCSVVENQMQPRDYWYEPPIVFECEKCPASFKNKNDLKQHICSTQVQPKIAKKNCCNICLKYFVSPSKLKRHFLVHTGQRPFRCDVCDKTFTQSSHLRTHRLTH